MSLEEGVADLTDYISFDDLLEVAGDLLTKGHALLSSAHQVFNLLKVILSAIVLMLFDHLNVRSAVILSDVFNEICAITDWLPLQSEDEGAVALIEAI